MCKQLFLFLIFYFPLLINAQNLHIVKPDGSVKSLQEGKIFPFQKVKLVEKPAVRSISQLPIGTEGVLDTIYQRDLWPQVDSNISYLGQDVLIQWFKAPADIELRYLGFSEAPSHEPNLANQVQIKLVQINWSESQLISATTGTDKHLGYYEAPGNGYNAAAPLMDDFDGSSGVLGI